MTMVKGDISANIRWNPNEKKFVPEEITAEEHEVIEIPGLPGVFGFRLNEIPGRASDPTTSVIPSPSISIAGLSETTSTPTTNEFYCDYHNDSEADQRIGRTSLIRVHESKEGQTLSVGYYALGGTASYENMLQITESYIQGRLDRAVWPGKPTLHFPHLTGAISITEMRKRGWALADGSTVEQQLVNSGYFQAEDLAVTGALPNLIDPYAGKGGAFLRASSEANSGTLYDEQIKEHTHNDPGHTHTDDGHTHGGGEHSHKFTDVQYTFGAPGTTPGAALITQGSSRDAFTKPDNPTAASPTETEAITTASAIADIQSAIANIGAVEQLSGGPTVTVGNEGFPVHYTGVPMIYCLKSTAMGPGFDEPLTTKRVEAGRKVFEQTSHGFSVGDWIRHDGTEWVLASGLTNTTSRIDGVVSAVLNTDSFELTNNGWVTGLSGLTAGEQYLSDTDGEISATAGTVTKRVGKAISATTMLVQIFDAGQGSGATVPPGTIARHAGLTAPSGYLVRDGSEISRTTYSDLATVVIVPFSGTTTSASPTISGISDTSFFAVGMALSGVGIPAGAKVASVSASSIDMDVNATASGTSTVRVYLLGGAGDGVTTFELPDDLGTTDRNSGENGIETTANGSAYDGGPVGSFSDDMKQGHRHGVSHNAMQNSGSGGVQVGGAYAPPNYAAATITVLDPTDDGVNGPSRDGNQTRAAGRAYLPTIKF